MSENIPNPFSHSESPEERERRLEKKTADVFVRVQRQRPDELLSAKEWGEFGMTSLYSDVDSQQEGFNWFAYAIPSTEDPKEIRVGIKTMNAKGLLDWYEVGMYEGVSLSNPNKQSSLEADLAKRRNRARAEKVAKEQERNEQFEKERGFAAGIYVLKTIFPHRDGKMKTEILENAFKVSVDDSLQKVEDDILSETQIIGIHNLGLLAPREGVGVELVLERNGERISVLEARVSPGGHIMSSGNLHEPA